MIADPSSLSTPLQEISQYSDAAAIYQRKSLSIEAIAMEYLRNAGMNNEYLSEVNAFFSSNLSAALEMGKPAYMEPDLAWVKQLLADRNIPTSNLDLYLDAYSHAVGSIMGKAGLPITDWISSYRSRNK